MLEKIIKSQKEYFLYNHTKSYSFRLNQLKKLQRLILENEDKISAALYEDLHKSKFESYSTEIGYCLHSLTYAIKHLKRWMKPKRVNTPIYILNSKSFIIPEPLGTVLIIGPYNYPFQLVIEPLIGAIAAGNTVIMKPSEMCTNTERVLAELINTNFDSNYLQVVTGDYLVTQELLRFSFDHIFFTGSSRVGQIVYEAASKHMTPVTLELGGKSPTIVDETADLVKAARRIAFGKFLNAGQTCIAPDYVYVHESVYDQFLNELNLITNNLYNHFDDFSHVVNERHFQRLVKLIDKEKVTNKHITEADKKFISPTIMKDVTWEDSVMKEEIFGPILPVLSYSDINDLIPFLKTKELKTKEKPLALYLFSKNKVLQKRVISEMSFGGGAINDTLMHISNHHLPFGGVGNSGFGAYHGKHSFYLFSHQKGYTSRSFLIDPPIAYPPYTKAKETLIRKIMK